MSYMYVHVHVRCKVYPKLVHNTGRTRPLAGGVMACFVSSSIIATLQVLHVPTEFSTAITDHSLQHPSVASLPSLSVSVRAVRRPGRGASAAAKPDAVADKARAA